MSHLEPDEVIRERLLRRLAELDALKASTAEDRKPIELDQTSVGRLSRMDALQMQAMGAASQRMRAAERMRLGNALRRLDNGEYGWCLTCGEPIAPERLAVDPAIPVCVGCAGKRE